MSSHTLSSVSGLNLHRQQHAEMPPAKHEYIIVPSSSAPSWGGYHVVDVKEKDIIVHDIIARFNVSPITGLTGSVANFPHYTPAQFWMVRVEIVIGGIVIDTLYATEQFIRNNLYHTDEDRRLTNNSMGAYDSLAQRNALATTTSSYFVNFYTLFKQAHIPLLFNHTEVQLRFYMDNAANNTNQSTLTGNSVSSIISMDLVLKVSRIPQQYSSVLKKQIIGKPHHYKFHETRYGTFNVQSGVSSTNLVLAPFSGSISLIYFVVRPLTGLTNNNQYQFTAINSFYLLNSSSTNISGGQSITNAMALQVFNKHWSLSSYCGETALGLTDNKANVYMYSFSADPIESMEKGITLNTYKFSGTEQLFINFASTLAAPHQVDVFALCDSVLEIGASHVKKLSI